MVLTLQLPLKPWPDPPLVLLVLLDVYNVSHPPSRPPGFPCCLSCMIQDTWVYNLLLFVSTRLWKDKDSVRKDKAFREVC